MTEMIRRTPVDHQSLCSEILALGATSFIDVALMAPELWSRFPDTKARQQVAELLGWPAVCTVDFFEQMAVMDFVAVFLNGGIQTAVELWHRHPDASEFLRATGRLDAVLRLLPIIPGSRVYPENPGCFLERCLDAGCFEVWRDIDPVAYRAALQLGFLEAISGQVPHRPPSGYPTTGGPVETTAQLIVARLLEFAGVGFEVNMCLRLPKRTPGWMRYPIDFVLSDANTCVIVTSASGSQAAYDDQRRVAWLKRVSRGDGEPRVLSLDSEVLGSAGGLTAFVNHVHVRLAHARIVAASLPVDPRHCIRPDAICKPFGHDGRTG